MAITSVAKASRDMASSKDKVGDMVLEMEMGMVSWVGKNLQASLAVLQAGGGWYLTTRAWTMMMEMTSMLGEVATCSTSTGPSGVATSAAVTITPATTKLTVIATGISSSTDVATLTASANSPTYSTIQNSTCLTAPEVMEGPYYVNNKYLCQDISKDVLTLG
ncbi:hypothetical protein B0J17DRAFT_714343 [Rhizoctonia solani]|nr:hypothetical protein B0J17DRAFT_714343 [Rhizoctonia solani]